MNISDERVAELPLHHGRAELLEEIMRTPVLDDRPTADAPPRRRTTWLVPVAAAAAVAALVAGTAWWAAGHDPESSQVAAASTDYRAVLDAPGWTVDNVFAETDTGELSYENGDLSFEITWYPADSYDDYVEDRRHITEPPSDGAPITALGLGAQMWAYNAQDHAAIRQVENGHWLELRGQGMGKAAYLDLLEQVRLVDEADFEAAMPDSFDDGGDREQALQEVLAELRDQVDPLIPPDSQRSGFASDQLPVEVARDLACEWLIEYDEAREAGSDRRAQRAAGILTTVREWRVLQEATGKGADLAEAIWAYADQAVAGQVPQGYAKELACEG